MEKKGIITTTTTLNTLYISTLKLRITSTTYWRIKKNFETRRKKKEEDKIVHPFLLIFHMQQDGPNVVN